MKSILSAFSKPAVSAHASGDKKKEKTNSTAATATANTRTASNTQASSTPSVSIPRDAPRVSVPRSAASGAGQRASHTQFHSEKSPSGASEKGVSEKDAGRSKKTSAENTSSIDIQLQHNMGLLAAAVGKRAIGVTQHQTTSQPEEPGAKPEKDYISLTVPERVASCIEDDCRDTLDDRLRRHSITEKELLFRLSRICKGPDNVRNGIAELVDAGKILRDPEHTEYLFLPVPDEAKNPGSPHGSPPPRSVDSVEMSDDSPRGVMPKFFTEMSAADRAFYERDSVAVLVNNVMRKPSRIMQLPVKVANNARSFTITHAMLERAKRGEDAGCGVHPYLLPTAVALLKRESICENPDATPGEDLHFRGGNPQLSKIASKFSTRVSYPD